MRGSISLFKAYKRAKILEKRGERTIKRLKKKIYTKKGLIWKRQTDPIKSKRYLFF
jgi:hypothetical protein